MTYQAILTTSLLQSYPRQQVCGYYMIEVYKKITLDIKNLVIEFWLEQKAIVNLNEANRRAEEVVFILCDKQWNIIGVNTAGIFKLNGHGRYYYFRMFINPKNREHPFSLTVFNQSRDYFLNRCKKDEVSGFIVVVENKKMSKPGWKRWYKKNNYQYLGQNEQNYDVWLATKQKK